jgi:hypothetical protein
VVVRDTAPVVAGLVAALLAACASLRTEHFDSDDAYKHYVAGLALSGVTGQAATARAGREGFACHPADGVIRTAPQEIVVVCQRHAADFSCKQDQSIVLQLDWVGTPKPEMAAGMRVRDVGSVATPKACD